MSGAVASIGCASPGRGHTADLKAIGRAAVLALYDELALAPKPGLVSFVDSGSHDDMDARSFMRSLFSLRLYFPRVARWGALGSTFEVLESEGIHAEARMRVATGGVNTHRGAVFCLGLLCASAGALVARGARLDAASLRRELMARWGSALSERVLHNRHTHGAVAARRFGLRSAAAEAALGFPVLFETTLPTRHVCRRCSRPWPFCKTPTSLTVAAWPGCAMHNSLRAISWRQAVPRDPTRWCTRAPCTPTSLRGACRPAARPTCSRRLVGCSAFAHACESGAAVLRAGHAACRHAAVVGILPRSRTHLGTARNAAR
jgi:triphosphoribosyl-dephospho-CoA synthase